MEFKEYLSGIVKKIIPELYILCPKRVLLIHPGTSHSKRTTTDINCINIKTCRFETCLEQGHGNGIRFLTG